MIVTLHDIPRPEMCITGAQAWFEANGLDWYDFKHNGIDSAILLAIDDVMAHRVVECARGRIE